MVSNFRHSSDLLFIMMTISMHNKKYYFFFVHIKNVTKYISDILPKNKELISAKAKKYYKKNKDRLSTQTIERYRSLPE